MFQEFQQGFYFIHCRAKILAETQNNNFINFYNEIGMKIFLDRSVLFFAYNDSIAHCGWAAFEGGEQVIKSPCGVKLFGDNGTFRQSTIKIAAGTECRWQVMMF